MNSAPPTPASELHPLDPIDGFLAQHLAFEGLRYQCSQVMFCPTCQACLDCGDAVSIDAFHAGGRELIATQVLCGRCADLAYYSNPAAFLSRIQEKCPGAFLELIDGRDYDDDGNYDPIHPALGPELTFQAARCSGPESRSGPEVLGLASGPYRLALYTQTRSNRIHVCELSSGYAVAHGASQTEALARAGRILRSKWNRNTSTPDNLTKAVRSVPCLNPQFTPAPPAL